MGEGRGTVGRTEGEKSFECFELKLCELKVLSFQIYTLDYISGEHRGWRSENRPPIPPQITQLSLSPSLSISLSISLSLFLSISLHSSLSLSL